MIRAWIASRCSAGRSPSSWVAHRIGRPGPRRGQAPQRCTRSHRGSRLLSAAQFGHARGASRVETASLSRMIARHRSRGWSSRDVAVYERVAGASDATHSRVAVAGGGAAAAAGRRQGKVLEPGRTGRESGDYGGTPARPDSNPSVSHTSLPPTDRLATEPQHPRTDGEHDRLDRVAELAAGRSDRGRLGIEQDHPPGRARSQALRVGSGGAQPPANGPRRTVQTAARSDDAPRHQQPGAAPR
jgi:hypothetical protein